MWWSVLEIAGVLYLIVEALIGAFVMTVVVKTCLEIRKEDKITAAIDIEFQTKMNNLGAYLVE